jgi:hypothetical protein
VGKLREPDCFGCRGFVHNLPYTMH